MAEREQVPKRIDRHGTSIGTADRLNVDPLTRTQSNKPNANTPLFVVMATYCCPST